MSAEDRFTNTPEDAARFEGRRGMADDPGDRPTRLEAERDEAVCDCYWTDPATWTTHYGAVYPGSQMEPNPDCPVHFPGGVS